MSTPLLNRCAPVHAKWTQPNGRQSVCLLSSRSPASSSVGLRHPADRGPAARWHSITQVTSDSTPIDNLSKEYCDSFECTSSPAVEQTVRSLAKDLERCRYTPRIFDKAVQYEDGFRSTGGPEKVAWQSWILDNVKAPKVTINRIQMLDKGTAQIDWNLQGTFSGSSVDIQYKTVFEMNLLTGRITSLKESWDLQKLSPPIAAMATGSRITYSAKLLSRDASGKLAELSDTLNSTFEEEDSQIYKDPTDPNKFFQQSNGQQNDYITYGLAVALIYLVFRGFSEIATL